ncbi:hypothetical protein DID88_008042 [Monilinia fructigena]|uniref:Uncharacterized protein n=1 Tax=Monilinia fructigena TaxID=38457 RepID=A0A395J547_9HELO|nr:hypothetical protein DID88_008042 [Monilinia fructigena]
MSSKPVKKVRYTSSTKGSSVHDGISSTPPPSSKPSSSTRRPSFSLQRHPSDSGVGSSSSNSATAQVNSTSFYTDAERAEQRQNVQALNEVVNTLKDRVQVLEHENRGLKKELSESNRERREFRRQNEEFRRQCEEHLHTIDDLKKEKSRAKESRDGKDSDGIRVRGSDIKTTPEKKDRSEKIPVTVERNTPPMTRREKERDSSARREEEHLRAQHQARERRTSYRESQGSPSPLYRDEDRDVNPMSPSSRYRDEDPSHSREKRHSGTPTSAKLPNPFAPLGPIGGNANTGRARRASVSYGGSPGCIRVRRRDIPGMTMGIGYERKERDEVPYIRGGVPMTRSYVPIFPFSLFRPKPQIYPLGVYINRSSPTGLIAPVINPIVASNISLTIFSSSSDLGV